MLSVAGLRPAEAPAARIHSLREEINVPPTPKYVALPFTPASSFEDGCSIYSRPRFQLPVRVADSAAEAEMPDCLRYV